jgi:cytochrome c oxidase cbb3-type subunit III
MEGDHEGTGVTKSRNRSNQISPPALSNPGFLRAGAAPDAMIKMLIARWHQQYLSTPLDDTALNDVVYYTRKRGKMLGAQWQSSINLEKAPIFKYFESPYSLEETKTNLQQAIRGMNFRAYSPRLLEQDLGDEHSINPNQTVFRFCNFRLLNEFLKIEPRLGVFLPCNATVIKTPEGKIVVAIPNLSRIVPMFNNRQLNERARDIITILDEMVEEALL